MWSWLLSYYIGNFVFFEGSVRDDIIILSGYLRLLLVIVVLRSLLNDLVGFGALNHANLAEVAQEVGPHDVMLLRQVLTQLR